MSPVQKVISPLNPLVHKDMALWNILGTKTSLEELTPYGFTCFAVSSELGVIVKGYQGIISKTSELMNNNRIL